jgi:hypothetical protein
MEKNSSHLAAAAVHLVLGFLVLVSKHNEVAMLRRHERRHHKIFAVYLSSSPN